MKSIMQDKHEAMCYLCMKLHGDYRRRMNLEEHHVIYGKGNRKLSERYGLKIYLCHAHHNDEFSPEAVHFNRELREYTCRDAQRAFREFFPLLDFREIFGKDYLGEYRKTDREPDGAAGFRWID